MNYLDVKRVVPFDDSIVNFQYHVYNPYTTTYANGEEIRICIQQQDLIVLPCESYIYIEGNIHTIPLLQNATDPQREVPSKVNNMAAFLFDEIKYELNGFEVDKCKNVGITSTMKGIISLSADKMLRMENASWNIHQDDDKKLAHPSSFNFCIPLSNFLGFAEDYRNVILNSKHELIILRSRDDVNLFCGDNDISRVEIKKIQWRIPHVYPSDSAKLKLYKIIERKESIQLNFRSWELHEYPALPINDKQIWNLKTSQQINTPRYVIIGFQTNRNNKIKKNKSEFDHCEITNVKVYLNSVCFPYENINNDFENNKYGILYDMFSRFKESYYCDLNQHSALLSYEQFKTISPLIVIDCSRQNEVIKKGLIDCKIEMNMKKNVSNNTTAYCLILHDNIITYNPYTNIVNKLH